MLSGKGHGQTRPTALGTMLNASTYGATIPTIFGTTRSALLAIWAANLRIGGSSKKAKKKGVTTYVENVDFLIGSNPIEAALQVWANNTGNYTMDFINLRVLNPISSGYTIADAHFYFLIGVTMEIAMSGTFNDYGSQGVTPYSGTFEYPLWNLWQPGSNLVDAGASRFWPYTFDWKPAYGATVKFPQNAAPWSVIPGANGYLHFYYMRTNKITKFLPPITFNRLHFEANLGSGTEYADAGKAAQQLIYPFYAGLGSSNVDLGSAGMLPQFRIEIKGSHALYPHGDCDFADMIEDIIRSGQIQVGAQLGLIQRGVNCNELPGPVQKNSFGTISANSPTSLPFPQPNKAGSILIDMARSTISGSGTNPTISDTDVNTWIPIFRSYDCGMWYAVSVGTAPGATNVVSVVSNNSLPNNVEHQILEMDPASNTIAAISTDSNTSAVSDTLTVSVTTQGPACLLLLVDTGFSAFLPIFATPPHFKWITNPFLQNPATPSNNSNIFQRNVSGPGTYSVKLHFTLPTAYHMALIAITQSMPSTLPKALGDIIDGPSLQLLRNQDRANGLIGSLAMDSQRSAADWLKDIYKCANGAPVWSGFKLKSIPRSEVSYVGNGIVYTPPTASGPVATLTPSDLIGDKTTPMIAVGRKAQVDTNNVLQVEFVDRNNGYNVAAASEPLSATIALLGPRKQSASVLHEIQDPAVARMIMNVEVQRYNLLRNTYTFTAMAKWLPLEAMDLILINDPLLNIVNLPVRLISVKENDKYELEMEAEPFIYGANAPNPALTATSGTPNIANSQYIPGPVNPPVIVEVPGRMSSSGAPEIWLVVSDSDPQYGGSVPYVSVDGGVSYLPLLYGPTGRPIIGNAVTGYVTQDFPPSADPDPVDALDLDLSESLGVLANYSVAEENNFVFPNYISGSPSPTPSIKSNSFVGEYNGPDAILTQLPGAWLTLVLAPYAGWKPNDYWCLAVRCDADTLSPNKTPMSVWFIPSGGPSAATPTVYVYRNTNGQLDYCTNTLPNALIPPFSPSNASQAFFVQPTTAAEPINPAAMAFAIQDAVNPLLNLPPNPKVFVANGNLAGATVTLVVSGKTFTYSGVASAALVILEFDPYIPGPPDPPLLAALFTGSSPLTTDTGHGWTLDFRPPDFTISGHPDFTWFSLSHILGTVEPAGANYELVTYQTAALATAPYHYVITPSSGAPIRRAVFGRPTPGAGNDHAIGTRFAFLDSWQSNPTPPGIMKAKLDPSWIGIQLWFKFVQFNVLGGGFEDLANVTAYSYTPVGTLSGGGSIGGGSGQPGQPGQTTYSITGGALTNPTPTTINMAQATAAFSGGNSVYYNSRVFTIPAPSAPTRYFITIYDPNQLGDTGAATTLAAQAKIDDSLVGVPGYVYIGSITVLPAGGGTGTSPGGYPLLEPILVNGV